MMSQPVRNVSAPRLAPPRRNSRRVGSGMSLVASLIRSLGSTPGITLRMRGMAPSLSSDDHGTQRLRHDEGHDDVNEQETNNRRHGEEMDITGRIIAAEQRGELLQLHRLPDREPRQHDDHTSDDDAEIEELLHGVVDREVGMAEPTRERGAQVGYHFAGS